MSDQLGVTLRHITRADLSPSSLSYHPQAHLITSTCLFTHRASHRDVLAFLSPSAIWALPVCPGAQQRSVLAGLRAVPPDKSQTQRKGLFQTQRWTLPSLSPRRAAHDVSQDLAQPWPRDWGVAAGFSSLLRAWPAAKLLGLGCFLGLRYFYVARLEALVRAGTSQREERCGLHSSSLTQPALGAAPAALSPAPSLEAGGSESLTLLTGHTTAKSSLFSRGLEFNQGTETQPLPGEGVSAW